MKDNPQPKLWPEARFADRQPGLPLHTIFCVGRNYAAHASELNNPLPNAPIIFTKPLTSIIFDGQEVVLPAASDDVHHEVEVVALIGKPGRNIPAETALQYVAGWGIGIDVTARDVQQQAKEKSHPWTVAKGYDTFAPLSKFLSAAQVPDVSDINFRLLVNGVERQKGNTRMMLFPPAVLIAYLSSIFTLCPGDLIFTGTPEGVSRLQAGDRLEAILGNDWVKLQVGVRDELL